MFFLKYLLMWGGIGMIVAAAFSPAGRLVAHLAEH